MPKSAHRPPGRPKRADSEGTDTTILSTAARLFMEHGFAPVTLEMVADGAGVTKAAIYYYFPTKADVFVSAMERLLHRIAEETARILTMPGRFADHLREVTEIRLKISETRFDFERVLQEAHEHLSTDQVQRVRAAMQRLADVLIAAFHEAAPEELRVPHPVFTAHAYLALLNVAYARDPSGQPLFPNAATTAAWIVALLTVR